MVQWAYEIWPKHDRFSWYGLNIIAIDGSKYNLPAAEEMRQIFQPIAGLKKEKAIILNHWFPQPTMSADVFQWPEQ